MNKIDICLGFFLLPAMIYRRLGKPVWLFSSRLDESDGNALALYRWMKKKKCDEKVFLC